MIDTKNKENLYMYLHSLDFVGKARGLLENHGYQIRTDGRWVRAHFAGWDTPWIHQYRDRDSVEECEIWHKLFFPMHKMVPSYCKNNCWKVVVDIPKVDQLFDLYELQKEMEHPCKCGLEMRPTDEKRYGGYFYNHTIEEGLECYEKVVKAIRKNISRKVADAVILKCACSEFEDECGPPLEWVTTEEQRKIEKMYDTWIVRNDKMFIQHDYMQAFVMLRWLHHAAMIGDKSYMKRTGGGRITKDKKTYHHLLKEFKAKTGRK